MRWVRELKSGRAALVSRAVEDDEIEGWLKRKTEMDNVPRLSYNWEEIQTQALFCAGKAKLDSRMMGVQTSVVGLAACV